MLDKSWLDGRLRVTVEPYVLALRSPFGTSHSSTTSRKNALITIFLEKDVGFGEVGLPPKKPKCYFADFDDVIQYATKLFEEISDDRLRSELSYQPFAAIPSPYFDVGREQTSVVNALFSALDHCSLNGEDYSLPARAGFEAAFLDLLGKQKQLPLFRMIGLHAAPKPAYITVGLDEIEVMKRNLVSALQHTRFVKIKVDGDVEKVRDILAALESVTVEHEPTTGPVMWSVDANSAWSPDTARRMLSVLAPYQRRIFMVEQPFPVLFLKSGTAEEHAVWRDINAEYAAAGLEIFADESVCNANDVEQLQGFVRGVNVKLEKAGGVRPALLALLTAQRCDLKIWLGVMVGSVLNSSTVAHLSPLCVACDPDGALLVTEASQRFVGGFEWARDGLALSEQAPGIGVVLRESS